jgi:hypothetical protein
LPEIFGAGTAAKILKPRGRPKSGNARTSTPIAAGNIGALEGYWFWLANTHGRRVVESRLIDPERPSSLSSSHSLTAAKESSHEKSATEDNVNSRKYQLELPARDFSNSFDELTLIKGNYQGYVCNGILRQIRRRC